MTTELQLELLAAVRGPAFNQALQAAVQHSFHALTKHVGATFPEGPPATPHVAPSSANSTGPHGEQAGAKGQAGMSTNLLPQTEISSSSSAQGPLESTADTSGVGQGKGSSDASGGAQGAGSADASAGVQGAGSEQGAGQPQAHPPLSDWCGTIAGLLWHAAAQWLPDSISAALQPPAARLHQPKGQKLPEFEQAVAHGGKLPRPTARLLRPVQAAADQLLLSAGQLSKVRWAY